MEDAKRTVSVYRVQSIEIKLLNLEGNLKRDNCTQLEGCPTCISCVIYLGNHSSVVIADSFLWSIKYS